MQREHDELIQKWNDYALDVLRETSLKDWYDHAEVVEEAESIQSALLELRPRIDRLADDTLLNADEDALLYALRRKHARLSQRHQALSVKRKSLERLGLRSPVGDSEALVALRQRWEQLKEQQGILDRRIADASDALLPQWERELLQIVDSGDALEFALDKLQEAEMRAQTLRREREALRAKLLQEDPGIAEAAAEHEDLVARAKELRDNHEKLVPIVRRGEHLDQLAAEFGKRIATVQKQIQNPSQTAWDDMMTALKAPMAPLDPDQEAGPVWAVGDVVLHGEPAAPGQETRERLETLLKELAKDRRNVLNLAIAGKKEFRAMEAHLRRIDPAFSEQIAGVEAAEAKVERLLAEHPDIVRMNAELELIRNTGDRLRMHANNFRKNVRKETP